MYMWYINNNGQQYGPMDKSQLKAYGLTPESYVWHSGMEQWQQACYVAELHDVLYPGTSSFEKVPPCPPNFYQPSGKDRIGAGLLAIFLGGLGIHYFYLGKTTAGILTIIITLVTCGIWATVMFIQGIVMLTMTQQQFDDKYVYTDSTMPLF